jgi:hypothetical protein
MNAFELATSCGTANGSNVVDQIAHRKKNKNGKHVHGRSEPRIPQEYLTDCDGRQHDPRRGEQYEQRTTSAISCESCPAEKAFKKSQRIAHEADGVESYLRIAEYSVE